MGNETSETLTVGYQRLKAAGILLVVVTFAGVFIYGLVATLSGQFEADSRVSAVVFSTVAIAWLTLSVFAAGLCLNFLTSPFAISATHDRLDIVTYGLPFGQRRAYSVALPVSADAGFAFSELAIGFEEPVVVRRDGSPVALRAIVVSWDMVEGGRKTMREIAAKVNARIWEP